MAGLADIQAAVDTLTANVTKITDAKTAGVQLLEKLSQLLRDNAGDPAMVRAIADAISNKSGQISSTADELMAAVLANTPAEEPPPPTV